jgi:hypothetical protein
MKISLFVFLLLFNVCLAEEKQENGGDFEKKQVLTIKDVKEDNQANKVSILILNKVTTKSYNLSIEIGKTKTFDRFTIEPLFCWKSLPTEIEENKVLLKIKENSQDIFYGWMFSSSPSINPFEHPMFDISVINCVK